MDNQNNEAHDLIVKAREALRRGDKETAHSLGEQAALLEPGMEDAWLVLTASDPNPEDALAYAQQALEINPSSERARKAVEWSIARLKQAQATGTAAEGAVAAPVPTPTELETPPEEEKSNNRTFLFAAAIIALLLCIVVAFTAYTGVTQPAFASILNNSILNNPVLNNHAAAPTQEILWAPMRLAKPSLTPLENGAPALQSADTPTVAPAQEQPTFASTQEPPTLAPTESSASAPTEAPSSAPNELPTEAEPVTTEAAPITSGFTPTPGVITMEIVEDTPTSQAVPPSSSAPLPAAATNGSGARWIDVDLTNQMVYAYQGDAVVNSFLVSTGTWLTPTVTGQYNIYVKYRSAPMSGPGYYLPDVPYIMYFYKGYGLHGTYWHSNFGTPMSHGCVNLRTDEAAWLYNWASVGTLVNVHY
jgi:lipoprotein-anchoring transpeptidase ErfK/SrfK